MGKEHMKRYGNLWDGFVSFENLVLASLKARRGKRSKNCVQRFEFDSEAQLHRLQNELISGIYRPGDYKTHWITTPKPRKISAAPYRDRVVHHALMNILEPILDRHFHPDSYACRKGRGTHAAADRLQILMKKNKYALQCDIQKFFPSIDHEIMKSFFRRLIKDKKILALMDMIVDHSNDQELVKNYYPGDSLFSPVERRKGLPIGNLTSQWFANWYLNGLDHFITKECSFGAYVRYCDDFIVLAKDRHELYSLRSNTNQYLDSIRLSLHPNKNFIRPVKAGLTFVGMRIWPHYRLLRKDNIKSFRRRVRWMQKAYAADMIDTDYIRPRLASWIGHSGNTNNYRLLRRLCREWKFKRAAPVKLSRYPRRQLEQQCEQLPGSEPQQQQPEQHQQQHRIPCLSLSAVSPAFSRIIRNYGVYGCHERDGENPRCCPVLMGRVPRGRISTRTDIAGKPVAEVSIRSFNYNSGMSA
jgi:RNA-directed DNA polymerase